MPNQNDIRQQITNQIVEALEKGGTPPWRRPWSVGKNGGAHANVVSRRNYRGLIPILLDLASETHGFSSRWWGTFNQWKNLGGKVMARPSHVPPGRWGTQICFWSPVAKKVQNDEGIEEDDRFFVLRLYTVFNADQCEGVDHLRADKADTADSVPIDYEPADNAIEATGATIRYGGNRAFYSPATDSITVPPMATFESVNEFYATCLHELTHWSEHPSRLNWSRKEKENTYQMGELVAEIASYYLCREIGVPASDDLTNHVAYVKSWLQAMRNDPRFIFAASGQASKAADFILSFSRPTEAESEEEPEAALVG
jgi:antirestriction protein ArdC